MPYTHVNSTSTVVDENVPLSSGSQYPFTPIQEQIDAVLGFDKALIVVIAPDQTDENSKGVIAFNAVGKTATNRQKPWSSGDGAIILDTREELANFRCMPIVGTGLELNLTILASHY